MQTTSAVRKTAPSSPATHVVPPAPHSYFALAISLLAVALGAIAYHSIPDPKRETKIIYWTITLIVFSFAIGFFQQNYGLFSGRLINQRLSQLME